jgi:hypothetical protein
MLREKLFLSTIFLVLSLLAGLACLPLFAALLTDPASAAKLGAAVILLLPLVSLGLLWRATTAAIYDLRRISFLSWAVLLCLIGVSNFIFLKDLTNSNTTILMLGVVCAAISLHAGKKAKKTRTS